MSRQVSRTVTIGSDLAAQFSAIAKLTASEAIVSSNLPYMLALEHGSSQQAPEGMVRTYRAEYDAMVADEVAHAFKMGAGSVQQALDAGVSMGALRVMAAIAERTPVDTGRAKGSWIATLPGGKRVESGPTVTPDQQRAIIKARRKRGREQ